MAKDYKKWNLVKVSLELSLKVPSEAYSGGIWWAHIGENIGHEIDGKSNDFSRPVLILKQLNKEMSFVIPLSTQIKTGSWYVPIRSENKDGVACLQQARAIDNRRLMGFIGFADRGEFKKIKDSFIKFIQDR